MTDQTIPADEVRKIIAFYRDGASDRGGMILDALHALLPPPPPPTLADMTPSKRAACQWMQCDVRGFQGQLVLATTCDDDDEAGLVAACGEVVWSSLGHVTPRPDLPRLEWPGDKKPEPAPAPAPALPEGWRLADHEDYGRVVVTNPTPDADGHVYFVAPAPDPIGNDWHICTPDELTYLDTPEAAQPNTLTVGSAWRYRDALARACEKSGRDQIVVLDRAGDAYVWGEAAGWWECSGPLPEFAPFTILHAGREAADAVD